MEFSSCRRGRGTLNHRRRGEQHVLALRRNKLAPDAAEFEPVTVPLDQIKRLAESPSGEMVPELRRTLGVDLNTAKILNEMSKHSGQHAAIVIRQNRGIDSVQSPVGVGVADTVHGRIISAVRQQGSHVWVTFGPGNYARFRAAMADLVTLTPAKNWFAARPW
jgi:hypothetical protein